MSRFLKIIGVFCGIVAFFMCISGGMSISEYSGKDRMIYSGLGAFFIGMGFFTGPLLIILSLSLIGRNSAAAAGKVSKGCQVNTYMTAPKESQNQPYPVFTDDLVSVYVGNLSRQASPAVLKTAFSGFGRIAKVRVIKDRSGRPKGFAFVDIYGREAAESAIASMNGKELAGRELKLSIAKSSNRSRR